VAQVAENNVALPIRPIAGIPSEEAFGTPQVENPNYPEVLLQAA
jgi:hypothetical protein